MHQQHVQGTCIDKIIHIIAKYKTIYNIYKNNTCKYKLNLPMPGYANSRGNRGGSLRLRWILRKGKSGFGGGAEFGKGEGEAEICSARKVYIEEEETIERERREI